MRRIVINVLRQMGHLDHSEAENGVEGIKHLASRCSDLVVIERHHADLSSLDFVRGIRRTASTQHVRVLMINTNVTHNDIIEASQAGVNAYISTPLTADTLKAQIRVAIGNGHRQTAAATRPESNVA